MTEEALLFDLDGTLIDSLADFHASANWVRARFDLPPIDQNAVRGMVGEGVVRLLERALADAAGTIDPALALRLWREHHAVQCTKEVALYPGAREHLARWHAARVPMAVVTNKSERFARAILTHLDLDAFLPVVIGGDTLPEKKPSPLPIHEALRRLGANGRRATMVGDGVPDLRAAKAAGLRTTAVLFGFGDPETLRAEGADAYWMRFGEPE